MVNQYSTAMRKKVVELTWLGFTPREIIDRNRDFGPRDEQTVRSILRDYLRTRSFVNPRNRRAPVGRMRAAHFNFLKNHLDTVDATLYLDEMRDLLRKQFGRVGKYSISCICATLIKRKVTRKVLSRIARRQNEIARAAFRRAVQGVDPSRFIFGDETKKCPRSLEREYGRGDRGKRVRQHRDFVRSQRGYSTLAFMTLDGIVANSVPTRAPGVDAERFKRDVQLCLLPILRRDSIVVWDNAAIHVNDDVITMIKNHTPTCMVLYLPPYSYDLNPIEHAFSSVKAYLQRHRDICRRSPIAAIMNAMKNETGDKAGGYFQSCGYETTEILPGFFI